MTTESAERAAWNSLAPYERAAAMKKHAPEIAEALLAAARQNMAHDRRIAWVNVISGGVSRERIGRQAGTGPE
ncbi:hypothetical protein OHA72_54730 [Dactylosporangium sp. NBC_01737]|uniref:hypothetical protein n=1 Tax=Dactylosporangium sp. NBC_01737 TaxID=2975959 RepID=UPI002E104A7B|nr:hypothetical protein OHA72_54730 [Dactylosporangium sp. NBC_01737]